MHQGFDIKPSCEISTKQKYLFNLVTTLDQLQMLILVIKIKLPVNETKAH
jgi:hypothetical protein